MAFDPWSYDADKDCYISMSEAMKAVNDYNYGVITLAQRDQVVALWQNGTKNPACEVEVAGWKLLDTKTVILAPLGGEIAGWKLLDTQTITLAPLGGEVAGWKLLNTALITLTPPGVQTCSVDADCPEGYECKSGVCVKKGVAFPWQWLAIGGAAIAGVILLIPKPKKAKEKEK